MSAGTTPPSTETRPAGPSLPPPQRLRGEVEVVGQRLETCRFGAPDVPLRVVLLHEGLGSVAAWRDFPDRLAARIGEPVLAYSRSGYGQSSMPGSRDIGFMHHEARVVLPALLRAVEVARPILIGHSDGASIALIHAGSGRASARPHGSLEGDGPLGVAVMAPHLFVEEVTRSEIEKVSLGFESGGLAARLARYHRDPVATFRAWADVWLKPAFRQWNIEAEVAAIDCPLLAIQGEQDQYGTALQIARLAALNPRAETLMLPDCRHSPHQEQPEVVLTTLAAFIARLDAASPQVCR